MPGRNASAFSKCARACAILPSPTSTAPRLFQPSADSGASANPFSSVRRASSQRPAARWILLMASRIFSLSCGERSRYRSALRYRREMRRRVPVVALGAV